MEVIIHAMGITIRAPITLSIKDSITPTASSQPAIWKDLLPVFTPRIVKASLKQSAPSRGRVKDATIARIIDIILKFGEKPAIIKQKIIAIVSIPMRNSNLWMGFFNTISENIIDPMVMMKEMATAIVNAFSSAQNINKNAKRNVGNSNTMKKVVST